MARRIFLTDDDADDRELFAEALAEVAPHIDLEATDDAEKTLQKLQSGSLPDVLFLDINLPAMNGWQCLQEIKSVDGLRNIPVVMYSTSSFDRDKRLADDLGALCFVTKPHNYYLLKKVLGEVVDCLDKGIVNELCQRIRDLES